MIIKSITSKSGRFLQLLDYLTHDKNKMVNERGESFVLKRFLDGQTNEEMAREFLETEKLRRGPLKSNSNLLIHEVLSFSDLDKDKITQEHLKVLTEAYLERISPVGQAYIICHYNEQHIHLHVVRQPLNIFGYSQRVDKKTYANIKLDIQRLQMEKFPELSNSIVEHGRKAAERGRVKQQELTAKEATMAIRHPGRISDKAKAREAIESCLIMAESREDFYSLLQDHGFNPYRRGNEYRGISDGYRNYRFTTLINDYAERFNALDMKQERMEELRDIRDNRQEREQEYEIERNYSDNNSSDEDNDDKEETNDSSDIYTK